MRPLLVAGVMLALMLGACSPPSNEAEKKHEAAAPAATETAAAPAEDPTAVKPAGPFTPAKTDAPSGDYTLDKAHSTLVFRVNHIGFSTYTAQFADFDAKLTFDAAQPQNSKLTATINTSSLQIPKPPAGFLTELLNEKWLSGTKFPTMTFESTAIDLTGPNTARIVGNLTLKGVTSPVILDAKFNGGYAGHPYDPNARVGFSATGALQRTTFGVSEGVPPPGSTMGVSDAVEITIETEFNGPPLKGAAPPPAPAQ